MQPVGVLVFVIAGRPHPAVHPARAAATAAAMPAGPPPRTTTSYSPYSGTCRAGSSMVLEGKLGFPDGERVIMPWAGDFSYRGDKVSVAFSTRTDTQAWCCSRSAELRK